ncbi:alpha-ketoglutarate-dependent dioxygenase AlkB family protein [Salinicola rhizosphaerae]|uniref:Alpha-ketoglutarate-dependent dioxygenase AlkB n=1 Tax=Salinicola rhizosphaerae TaxID=1443141 RepID=A0ABQ3DPQ5_9GAMM|nr:alpha-ketoglutarate-dependent dioxygenase AlkB [Salinicola rhizosphaerae]GHB09645.1 alpha-ketoglutarate-dependent dioxygenase AlkB [Salinicola rhizosphaerae]
MSQQGPADKARRATIPAESATPWQVIHPAPLLALQPDFLTAAEADSVLHRLDQEIDWHSPTIQIYGRQHKIPRAQCWMGDDGLAYRYSGHSMYATPWHPGVEALRDRVIHALDHANLPFSRFNSVLLNRYRGGEERMGWHSDDEVELGHAPIVAALSLGSERPLRFRDRQRQAFNVWLPHGSLLLMGPGAQSCWQHALAPRKIAGTRISLTFRRIVSDAA